MPANFVDIQRTGIAFPFPWLLFSKKTICANNWIKKTDGVESGEKENERPKRN